MKLLLMLASNLLPWTLRRWFLRAAFGYQIDDTAWIGWALVLPKQLIMEPDSKIGHLTVVKGIDLLHLKAHALIGR
ncbi:hypothetical protein, partial [Thermomonas sp.]|uniref:hypothetical protein n=1 Tax=Thermomonas sp. TaxID=1971895 RepID=UPI00260C2FB0